jgi:hypothetical protein
MVMPIKLAAESQAYYQVGLKLLLRKDGEFLFLKPPVGTCFDLPGGRMGKADAALPLSDFLYKKVAEELGPSLKFKVKGPLFQYTRYFRPLNLRVFITVYEGVYISGPIQTSRSYLGHQWLNPIEHIFEPKNFMNMEEFRAFRHHFQTVKAYAPYAMV